MAALITDDMLHAFAIVAPPAGVPQMLARRCAGVVSRVSFIIGRPTTDLLDALGCHSQVAHPDPRRRS
jgi:hypothetical protein